MFFCLLWGCLRCESLEVHVELDDGWAREDKGLSRARESESCCSRAGTFCWKFAMLEAVGWSMSGERRDGAGAARSYYKAKGLRRVPSNLEILYGLQTPAQYLRDNGSLYEESRLEVVY